MSSNFALPNLLNAAEASFGGGENFGPTFSSSSCEARPSFCFDNFESFLLFLSGVALGSSYVAWNCSFTFDTKAWI